MADQDHSRYRFEENDYALVLDRKGRHYLIKLKAGSSFDTHLGNFGHDAVIGQEEGVRVQSTRGHWLLAVKPTMAEFTRVMPRIATVVYPKDLGAIITRGDLFPGARVLEAGCGSGAVTITIVRAIGERGKLFSYDLREDMINLARSNVAAMVPGDPPVTFKLGDVYEEIEERDLDRIILDLPEPWHVVPHASEALVPGGIMLCFLPTVLQVHELTQTLRAQRTFDMIDTVEFLMRPWQVGNRAVRPDQRMVGHTGFITTARKVTPLPRPDLDEKEDKGE